MLKKLIIILKDRKDVIKNFSFCYRLKMSWFKNYSVRSHLHLKQNSQCKKLTKHKKVLVTQQLEWCKTSLFDSQSQKCKWEDDNDEPWWELFKSEPSTQKLKKIGGIRLNPNHQRKNQLLAALK